MAGLSVYTGLRGQFGGSSGGATVATPGTNGGMAGVTAAAFSPGATPVKTGTGGMSALIPNTPFGLGFWMGVGALGLLILIRHSLPR